MTIKLKSEGSKIKMEEIRSVKINKRIGKSMILEKVKEGRGK